MTQKDLKKLKSRLPKNYREKILEILKAKGIVKSPQMISYVLSGKFSNTEIIIAAIELAEKTEIEEESLSKAARGDEKLDKLKFNLQN